MNVWVAVRKVVPSHSRRPFFHAILPICFVCIVHLQCLVSLQVGVGPRRTVPSFASRLRKRPVVVECSRCTALGSEGSSNDKEDLMMSRWARPLLYLRAEVQGAVERLGWPPLLARDWVTDDRSGDREMTPGKVEIKGNTRNLSVLQWNVLSDGLSGDHPNQGGFVRSPPDSLDWQKRKWRILEEVLSWDCDVLTLQEVDHHEDWLSPQLERVGYRGVFIKKPAAPALDYGSDLEDGCSIFYRSDRLELLDFRGFTYCVPENGDTNVEADDITSTGKVDEGGTGSLVVLATTHLKASKEEKGELIRAQQVKQLLDEVQRFRSLHTSSRGLNAQDVPVVVTGDFNAIPHTFLGPSKYKPQCFNTILQHPLKLRSAFDVDSVFTTWKIRPKSEAVDTIESKHCIDYIWVSEGVEVAQESTMPTGEALGPPRAPSYVYPSDHFALAVKLQLPQLLG
ncbi:unnamed protein product [Choristocarpus tenellus]